MTPEVSAIVRELRERAATEWISTDPDAYKFGHLLDGVADEIEAGTFVTAEVATVVAPKIGDRWGDLTPEQWAMVPVGAKTEWAGLGNPVTITKTRKSHWVYDDGDPIPLTDGLIADNRIIVHLPTDPK